jgi:uncharacterized protein YdaT
LRSDNNLAWLLNTNTSPKDIIMPWYNGNFPPSYKNQPVELREKAIEIANALLREGLEEGVAIALGLKRARELFGRKRKRN